MSLSKRHIGRKVAGVGVGVAMLVLGLQAPAMANTAVTAVSPTSGPTNCVVVITGTGFRTFPDASNTLTFVAPTTPTGDVSLPGNALNVNWFSVSDTEIWAAVPALATGTSYTIKLTQPSGTFTAGGTFLSTGGVGGAAGGCAPTITSFTPTCALKGVVVTITGTNLLDASNLTGDNSGGDVFFRSTAISGETQAQQPIPDLSEATSISAIVPSNIADGPIRVQTDVDANAATAGVQGVFSSTSFQTPPPDCAPVTGTPHARSISFKIKKSGNASGTVSSTEDPAFTDCVAAVPVKIQKKTSSGWKTVGKATTTDTGSYSKKVKNPKGTQKFRALAPKVSLGDPVTDVCSKAKSATRKV
jgi:IPT/TIG domain